MNKFYFFIKYNPFKMADRKLTVHRKSYVRKDGTRVKSTTYQTPDLGGPGKGPKTLPPIPHGPDERLSTYGYSLSLSSDSREKALRKAIHAKGALIIGRRLNLIRNYTANIKNKTKLSRDVEFVKEMYALEKSRSKK